jgi:hypothetical protein
VCRLFAETYPQAAPKMKRVLDCDIKSVDNVLAGCGGFDLPVGALIQERRDYLQRLIAARRAALGAALGA